MYKIIAQLYNFPWQITTLFVILHLNPLLFPPSNPRVHRYFLRHWLQVAALFDPVYYAVEAARALMNGQLNAPVVYQAFAVLIPITGLVFWWTIRSYRTVVA